MMRGAGMKKIRILRTESGDAFTPKAPRCWLRHDGSARLRNALEFVGLGWANSVPGKLFPTDPVFQPKCFDEKVCGPQHSLMPKISISGIPV